MFSLFLVLMGSSAAAGEPAYGGLGAILSGGDKGKAFSEEEPRYIVRFQGREYSAIYEIQTDRGIPIDLYYYRIPPHKGVPAAQDGQNLWGRFVRVPSADHFDQSSVVWWHAWWTYENGRWLYHEAENIPYPEVVQGKGGTVRKEAPAKIPSETKTKKSDAPKEKKPPAGSPPKDLGEL